MDKQNALTAAILCMLVFFSAPGLACREALFCFAVGKLEIVSIPS